VTSTWFCGSHKVLSPCDFHLILTYSGVFRFESRSENRISWLKSFVVFPQCFKSTCGIISRLGHDHVLILPNFSITNYPLCVRVCVCARARARERERESAYVYVYIYIRMFVCVCVCVCKCYIAIISDTVSFLK